MGISIETLVASKKFTSETVLGGGAVVGKNVTISSISPIDGGNRITFSYTLDNGTVKISTLDVMNGVDGSDGKDGKTPVKGIDYKDGEKGDDGIGITSVEKTKTEDLVDTYTITFSDGNTFEYEVANGKSGSDGKSGKDGKDAVSPTITENADNTDKIYKLDVTTADRTFTTPNLRGKDGSGSSSGEENTIESISVNGTSITPDKDKNVDITIPTVDVTKDYVDTALNDKAEKNHTHTVVNGHTVESDVPTDAKFTDTIYDDSTLKGRVSKVEENIGDVTTIQISSVTDLVGAINALYNSFMSGMTYKDKKLVINYRNGQKTELDLSPIITDTTLTELSNVDDTGITDGQVLKYDTATSKYIPTTIDTVKVLADAKKYTDGEIAKMNHMDAIAVDAKPTYSDGTITYVKNSGTLTTENSDLWFYYNVDGMNYQTLFIDGVEFTISVDGDIDFKDFVSKTNDITDTYTGEETDKSKIVNISALDALYTIIATALGKKVNTADIVNSLISDAVDKPLSAAQGKVLDEKKLNVEDVVDNLTTTDTDKPLSANQGKVLDNKISEINKSTKEQFGTSEGKYIHIEDSVSGNATEIGVAGKSVQNQYEGKNILKPDITTGSQNGITCTVNSDGTCVLNGTATADTYLNINTNIEVSVRTTYKLVGCPKNDSVSLFARRVTNANSYGEDTGNGVTFVPDENVYVFIKIESGATLNNVIFRPMLTTDLDATYDDFEPYVGGIPSPNPEYPQNITSVGDGGNIVITSCSKNLITYPYSSITKTTNGITYTVKDDGTVIADGTASESYNAYFNYMYKTLKLSNASYTLSCDGLPKGVYVYVYDETIKSSVANVTNTPSSKTFIGDSTHIYSLSINVSKGITVDNLVFKPQLEIGDKATEYESSKSSNDTISLSEPLRSIGDVKDEITYQNGKLGILRRIGKYTIEDMDIQTPGNFGEVNYTYTVNSTINIAASESPLLCNLFIDHGYLNVRNNDIIGCGCQADGNIIFGLGKDSSIQTVDAFKTWATNNNLVLQFVLKNPTFEELDQSIPYGIVTYKGTTNISSSEDTEISVTYPLTDSAASGSKNEAKIAELENEIAELKSKMVTKTVDDVAPTKLKLAVPSTQTLTNDQSSYCVINGVCYLHIAVGWSNTAEMGWTIVSNVDMPIPLNEFKSSIAIPEGFVHISVGKTDEGGDLNIYCPKLNASRTLYMDFCYPVK